MEIAWVHRVTIREPAAEKLRLAAAEQSVCLSVHAPYYINLNSGDPQKLSASKERLVAACRAAEWSGASDVVFHAGFYHDDSSAVVLSRLAEALCEVRETLGEAAGSVTLRPETMGKHSQFGGLEDILALCRAVPGVEPCVDIAHLHARTGAFNTASQFESLWSTVSHELGPEALRGVHLHVSGIEYSSAGEIRHLPLRDSDLDYRSFLRSCRDCNVSGRLIAESPAREEDVSLLQAAWREVRAEP